MGLDIRGAAPADIPAMHGVRIDVRENRLSDARQITEASYRPYIAAGSAWVAEVDGVVAGFAALDPIDASVWALFVDPAAEGCGIGRALHQAMIDWARQKGIPRLSLTTDDGSRAARFYERAGWTRVSAPGAAEARFEKALA